MNYCKKCSYPIIWKKEDEGWRPYNENGSKHFETCKPNPNAQKILDILKNKQSQRPQKIQIGEDEFI